jgi:RNA polymerase sigma factor (sigma-70 family)
MGSSDRAVLLNQLERLYRGGTYTALSDAQLLDRYLSQGDEGAFEVLVNQHGPMVYALCRRILHDPRDVEDAFQATFLVLVKKGRSIRDRGSLSSWLYGVAYRVALRCKAQARRRSAFESPAGELEVESPPASESFDEIGPILDQELNRLPEKYRAPIVLCYLRERTHDQAAAELRWPVGTVRSRLARGRDLLRDRLTRRGYALSLALVGLGQDSPFRLPRVSVPPALIRASVSQANRFLQCLSAGAGSSALLSSMSGSATTLAQGVLTTMAISPFKLIGAGVASVGLFLGGLGAGAWAIGSSGPGQKPDNPEVRVTRTVQDPTKADSGTTKPAEVPPTTPPADGPTSGVESRLKELERKLDLLIQKILPGPERESLRAVPTFITRPPTALADVPPGAAVPQPPPSPLIGVSGPVPPPSPSSEVSPDAPRLPPPSPESPGALPAPGPGPLPEPRREQPPTTELRQIRGVNPDGSQFTGTELVPVTTVPPPAPVSARTPQPLDTARREASPSELDRPSSEPAERSPFENNNPRPEVSRRSVPPTFIARGSRLLPEPDQQGKPTPLPQPQPVPPPVAPSSEATEPTPDPVGLQGEPAAPELPRPSSRESSERRERHELLAAPRDSIRVLLTQLRIAQRKFERTKQLFQQGVVGKDQYESALDEVRLAVARLRGLSDELSDESEILGLQDRRKRAEVKQAEEERGSTQAFAERQKKLYQAANVPFAEVEKARSEDSAAAARVEASMADVQEIELRITQISKRVKAIQRQVDAILGQLPELRQEQGSEPARTTTTPEPISTDDEPLEVPTPIDNSPTATRPKT